MKTDNALLMLSYKKKFHIEPMTASTSKVVTIAPTYRYYLIGTTIKAL